MAAAKKSAKAKVVEPADEEIDVKPKKSKRKAKYITVYSPFLMKETKHELIGEPIETENGRKQWARCNVSHHSQLINLDTQEEVAEKASGPFKLDRADSKEYSPKAEYQIGDVIYNKPWDDVGIVRSKEIMSNGRASLLVQFEKNKERRLVENFK